MPPLSAHAAEPPQARKATVEWLDTAIQGARLAIQLPRMLPAARCNPARMMRAQAARRPAALALRCEDRTYSWARLELKCAQRASWLYDQGVTAGDVVALMMDNREEFLFLLMGLSHLGAVAALINTQLSGKALRHALASSKADRVLVGSEHAHAVAEACGAMGETAPHIHVQVDAHDPEARADALPEELQAQVINAQVAQARPRFPETGYQPHPDHLFCYVYTSGTTGLPKAALIRNQRMMGANLLFGYMMHRSSEGDVIYVPLPLYHSSALFLGWGSALATGASIALRRRFSASRFWQEVQDTGATSFVYIGELCRYLLNQPESPADRAHGLRVAVGNGLRPDIWEAFQQRFDVPVIREFYGSTEGNAPALNMQGKPGMIGKLSRGQAVLRCDPSSGALQRNAQDQCIAVAPGETGLLVGRISGLSRFDGYLDDKASASKVLHGIFRKGDRYFDTGDLVKLHPDRWLSFVDRLGDTFRWKGENVSTQEVAELLNGAANVLEANVYGVEVPHNEGRAGMAALCVREGFDLGEFHAFVEREMASFQRPVFIRILRDQMRTTGTLKHNKVGYREEGYDIARIDDALYLRGAKGYLPLNKDRFAQLQQGSLP